MKTLKILIIFTLMPLLSYAHENWSLDQLDKAQLIDAPFVSHKSEGYLQMNLNYNIVKQYFELVDQYSYRPLKSRGEAHITLISPPEYNDILKKYISIEEIEKIAKEENIQQSVISPICIGRGRIEKDSKVLDTYYIVVESAELLKIRNKIFSLYNERSGKSDMTPSFYPHIKLGFTDRDLHISDGVVKDKNSCLQELHISSLKTQVPYLNTIPNAHYVYNNKTQVVRGNAPLNYKNLKILQNQKFQKIIIFKNDKAGEVSSEVNGLKDLGYQKDQIENIPFDWKDNQDFLSGCKKIVNAISSINTSIQNHQNVFFHCTTGEDRTGVLSALFKLSRDYKQDLKRLSQTEMCERGFEAGDKTKDKEVVLKIRAGLTQVFLKMAYTLQKYQTINETICEKDPSADIDYQTFHKKYYFECI